MLNFKLTIEASSSSCCFLILVTSDVLLTNVNVGPPGLNQNSIGMQKKKKGDFNIVCHKIRTHIDIFWRHNKFTLTGFHIFLYDACAPCYMRTDSTETPISLSLGLTKQSQKIKMLILLTSLQNTFHNHFLTE